MRIALFDLDHTLLPLDSDHAWGAFTTDIGWTDEVVFKARNDAFYEDYKAGTLDLAEYIRFTTSPARERGAEAAFAARERFMAERILPAVRSQATALLERHRQAGDLIAIVTATNEFVTRPIATALGVDELLAVQLENDASGWMTGEIAGIPSFREGKVTRVAAWLKDKGLNWDTAQISFYSDSINDLALLEKVQWPVATNPDARLTQVARERFWPVLKLFEDEAA